MKGFFKLGTLICKCEGGMHEKKNKDNSIVVK